MPSINLEINKATEQVQLTTGRAGGFVDGITENVLNNGESSLQFAKTIKAIIDGKEATQLTRKVNRNGKRIVELGKRFSNAFGFVSSNGNTAAQEAGFADITTGAAVVVKDGRSSYEEFTLKANGIELKFGYTGLVDVVDNVFAPPPLVSFKRSKRIDETIVSSNNLDGTEANFGQVVENYGRKPIEISIKGILVDMVNHQYPSDKVKLLNDLFDYNGIWNVEGQIFRDHNIYSLYITDAEDAPVQGYMDTWSFTLEARSIKPVLYFLNK